MKSFEYDTLSVIKDMVTDFVKIKDMVKTDFAKIKDMVKRPRKSRTYKILDIVVFK